MFLSVLTFLTALCISVVAIYYSVAGLIAIFASAAVPVMIMGTTLEIAKLVTAVWLHRYWNAAVWWLKSYLLTAVLILMTITSIGIFGFLSKAHIDQTSTATENLAVIEQITQQIDRDQLGILRAEQEIEKIQSSSSDQDSRIQEQINLEQSRIDSAYARIQPAIDEQNIIISKEEAKLGVGVNLYKEQISAIDQTLASIEGNIASGNVRAVQALVGVDVDGRLGPATERAIDAFRSAQTAEKQRLINLIASESQSISSPVLDAARFEIQRLRSLAEKEIADSNQLISRLRSQLGTADVQSQTEQIARQQSIIQETQNRIAEKTQKRFELESEYRKLEAEVGPIKYLAEFVYGSSANKDLLEEAVKWVILLIIVVFDPLAVLLLIASQHSYNLYKEQRKTKEISIVNQPIVPSVKEEIKATVVSDTVVADTVVEEPSKEEVAQKVENLNQRLQELLEKESDEKWKLAKIRWKIDNPRANTKNLRQLYIDGNIDKLPWEDYVGSVPYVQNSEQDENSMFAKIQKK
jgi:hypothetical protein